MAERSLYHRWWYAKRSNTKSNYAQTFPPRDDVRKKQQSANFEVLMSVQMQRGLSIRLFVQNSQPIPLLCHVICHAICHAICHVADSLLAVLNLGRRSERTHRAQDPKLHALLDGYSRMATLLYDVSAGRVRRVRQHPALSTNSDLFW
jgi:hypothetical protein